MLNLHLLRKTYVYIIVVVNYILVGWLNNCNIFLIILKLLWMRLRELSLTVLYWLLVRLPRALGSASECRFTSSVTSENGDALSFSSSSGSANLPSCSAHSSTASGSSGCIAPLLKQLGELAAECTVVATCIENFFGDSRSVRRTIACATYAYS